MNFDGLVNCTGRRNRFLMVKKWDELLIVSMREQALVVKLSASLGLGTCWLCVRCSFCCIVWGPRSARALSVLM